MKNCLKKICMNLNKYALIYHYVLACAICFFIESFSRHSTIEAILFIKESFLIFAYNALIIYITFLPVFLTKRRMLLRILISGIWCALGIINGCVLNERVTPFGFTDLKLIGDLFAMKSTYFTPFMCGMAIALFVIFILSCICLYLKGPTFKGKIHRGILTVLIICCFFSFPMITNAAVDKEVLVDYFDNIAQGYETYGFVYGFSSSVVDRGMEKPDNYSKEEIDKVLTKNNIQINKNRSVTISDNSVTIDSLSYNSLSENSLSTNSVSENNIMQPNIIVVLLESFVDPSELLNFNCSTDPIPNFHRLENEFSTGHLDVPVVGAGTANTEFEILTGMSIGFFGTGEYPFKTVLKNTSCESIASNLSDIGYHSTAIHNNSAKFYGRNNVFGKMEFDNFISKEFMNIKEYTPLKNWPTDHILVNEVQKALDNTEDQSDFIYTITVQGHGAYPTEKVIENPLITVSSNSLDQEKINQWEYYVNEIHEVDNFIGDLTSALEERNENTIVVFFGDHLPTLDIEGSNLKTGDIYKTKYITWNNFGLDKVDCNLTTYQLLAHTTNQIGIHEGTIFELHQKLNGTSTAQNNEYYQKSLELLQYDLLYGKKYIYDEQDLFPGKEIEMGIASSEIETLSIVDGKLHIIGNDFTKWSKIYINGELVKTKFLDENHITSTSKNMELNVGDEIVVNQCGGETILRSSNVIIY